MDPRFLQANLEACWTAGLSLAYMICWVVSGYFCSTSPGITTLPKWFELSCLFLPIIFVAVCWITVKLIFKDMPLENNNEF